MREGGRICGTLRHMLAITLCSIPTLSAPIIHGYNHRVPLWDRQCVTSVIQYATDIEKALSEAAKPPVKRGTTSYCVETSYQISKKLEESRKIKMS